MLILLTCIKLTKEKRKFFYGATVERVQIKGELKNDHCHLITRIAASPQNRLDTPITWKRWQLEVQVIEDKLKEVHNKDRAKVFSDEQLRTWAHLIQMGKHSSYDTPPDKPFWNNRKTQKHLTGESSTTSATPDKSKPPTVTISPGKRVSLRGQCVEQLFRLHQLMEKARLNMTKCKNQ